MLNDDKVEIKRGLMTPGNSRIRDCERWIRQNGFVVLPSDWDSSAVRLMLSRKLGPSADIRNVVQSSMTIDEPTHVHILVVNWKGVPNGR